jgi:hypothetical protein
VKVRGVSQSLKDGIRVFDADRSAATSGLACFLGGRRRFTAGLTIPVKGEPYRDIESERIFGRQRANGEY